MQSTCEPVSFPAASRNILNDSRSVVASPYKSTVKELMPLCPVCEKTCRGHQYIELGACSQVAFYELVVHLFKKHDWQALRKVGSAEPGRGSLAAFAIRGDHPLTTVALVSNPPEAYGSSWIMLQDVVPDSEVAAMQKMGLNHWQPI